MHYESYSEKNFTSCSPEQARSLSDQLQHDVSASLHGVILTALQEIVKQLNAVGHNLTPYDEIRPGDISYRDESSDAQCQLRLGCDTIISVGYRDTVQEGTEP